MYGVAFLRNSLKQKKKIGNKMLFLQAEKWFHDASIGTWVKSNIVHP